MVEKKEYYVMYAAYIKHIEYKEDEDEYEIVLVIVTKEDEEILIELHLTADSVKEICEFLKTEEKK